MLEEKEKETRARMIQIMSSLSEDWKLSEEDLKSINNLFENESLKE